MSQKNCTSLSKEALLCFGLIREKRLGRFFLYLCSFYKEYEQKANKMKVLKFGGTSMGSVEGLQKVVAIVRKAVVLDAQVWVVVSAMEGVTNKLLELCQCAASANKKYLKDLEKLSDRHLLTFRKLCGKEQREEEKHLLKYFESLQEWLQGVYLLREASSRSLDLISSFGERLSARMLTFYLQSQECKANYLDARALFRTEKRLGATEVNTKRTYENIKRYYKRNRGLHIVTGYIASNEERVTTTLGRGGSDYTATLIAAALQAEEVEIWTDVDGIMTANPRAVPEAYTLSELSYEETLEMAHFGAKVIYPRAIYPASEKSIPIRIRNTFSPSFSGTYISAKPSEMPYLIRNLSAVSPVALIRVLGSPLISCTDMEARCLRSLAQVSVPIILLSQGSAAYALTFVVRGETAKLARETLEQTFATELQRRAIKHVQCQEGYGLVAAIGKHMLETPGIAACIFGALVRRNINVKMTVQGTSDLSFSIVVAKEQIKEALSALHNAFFLPDHREISVFLVGVGLIGSELLAQFAKIEARSTQKKATQFVLKGVANSRKMCLTRVGIPFEKAINRLETAEPYDLSEFVEAVKDMRAEGSLFVDCTSSETVVEKYALLLQSGTSIVTPNKRAFSGSRSMYKKLQLVSATHFTSCFYETTVGAGLPVLSTLRDLIASGDKILKIEGVLSGTFSYIFNRFDEGGDFCELIKEAKAKGLTEPDPREDLKGTDVARKLLILAREAGYLLKMEDISLTSCLPLDILASESLDDFYEGLRAYVPLLEQQRKAVQAEGKHLCFLASFEPPNKARIELSAVDKSHPCYVLSGEDNIVAFTTSRYKQRPLIVRGPGAGASVTAAGLLADIIKASEKVATHYYPFRNLT